MRTEIDPNESISSVNAFTKRTEIDLRSVSDRFKLDRFQWERPLRSNSRTAGGEK